MKRLMPTALFVLAFYATPFAHSPQSKNTPQTLKPFVTDLRICGAISVDSDQNIRISEWTSRRIGIYDKRGKLVRTIEDIGEPSGSIRYFCF